MKRICVVLFLLAIPLGCKVIDPVSEEAWYYDRVFVEGMDVPDSVRVDEAFLIRVWGHLPDPSWAFDHFELLFEDSALTVWPIGRKDLNAGYVIQVLVPFEAEASFDPPQSGMMDVEVVGKAGTVAKRIMVTDRR